MHEWGWWPPQARIPFGRSRKVVRFCLVWAPCARRAYCSLFWGFIFQWSLPSRRIRSWAVSRLCTLFNEVFVRSLPDWIGNLELGLVIPIEPRQPTVHLLFFLTMLKVLAPAAPPVSCGTSYRSWSALVLRKLFPWAYETWNLVKFLVRALTLCF